MRNAYKKAPVLLFALIYDTYRTELCLFKFLCCRVSLPMLPYSWLGPNSTRINRRQQRPETGHNSISGANNSDSSSSRPPLLPVRTVDSDTSDSDDEYYYCDGLDEDLEKDYDGGDCVLDLAELAAQVILFFKVNFAMMFDSENFTEFYLVSNTVGAQSIARLCQNLINCRRNI